MHAFIYGSDTCARTANTVLVRLSVQCKPIATLKQMMSSHLSGGGGALTSEAPRKSVMPTAGLLVDSHSGLSSRA